MARKTFGISGTRVRIGGGGAVSAKPKPKFFRKQVVTRKFRNLANLDGLVAELNMVGEAVESELAYRVLDDGAAIVQAKAKQNVAYQTYRQHPAGWEHARDVIFASRGDPSKDKKGPSVVVGVNARKAPQAFWLEFGTAKMKAQPFWRRAVRESRSQVASIFADGIRGLIAQSRLAKALR